MRCLGYALALLAGCDGPALTTGQLGQAPDQEAPRLCEGAYAVARAIPTSGWVNQVLVEATAPDDDAGPELGLLVGKFGLVKYESDPGVYFYSWGDRNKVDTIGKLLVLCAPRLDSKACVNVPFHDGWAWEACDGAPTCACLGQDCWCP